MHAVLLARKTNKQKTDTVRANLTHRSCLYPVRLNCMWWCVLINQTRKHSTGAQPRPSSHPPTTNSFACPLPSPPHSRSPPRAAVAVCADAAPFHAEFVHQIKSAFRKQSRSVCGRFTVDGPMPPILCVGGSGGLS